MKWIDALGGIRIADEMTYLDHAAATPMLPEAVAAMSAPLPSETFTQAFYARDLAGIAVSVGVPTPEMTIEPPLIDVFGHGGATKSSWYGDCLPSRDFPMLIDLHLQGRLRLEKFVTETIGLDDVEEAFHRVERGEVLRSVVVL